MLNCQENKEKTGEKNEIRSGSPNIPNLRTFTEFISFLKENSIIQKIQQLSQLVT